MASLSRQLGALKLSLLRLPLAALLLLGLCLAGLSRPDAPLGPVLILALSGLVGQGIGDTLLYAAMIRLGARLSMLLLSLTPPLTALLAYLFRGETLSPLALAGIGLTVAGVSWVVVERRTDDQGRPSRVSIRGVALAAAAASMHALGLVLSKEGLAGGVDPLLGSLVRNCGGTSLVWFLALISGRIRSTLSGFRPGPRLWLQLLAGVSISSVAGVWLSLIAVRLTKTGVAATLMATVPLMMLPLVALSGQEKISRRAVLGALVAVAGVAVLFWR